MFEDAFDIINNDLAHQPIENIELTSRRNPHVRDRERQSIPSLLNLFFLFQFTIYSILKLCVVFSVQQHGGQEPVAGPSGSKRPVQQDTNLVKRRKDRPNNSKITTIFVQLLIVSCVFNLILYISSL